MVNELEKVYSLVFSLALLKHFSKRYPKNEGYFVSRTHGQSKEFEMDVKLNNNRIVNIHSIKDGQHECDDTLMESEVVLSSTV